jgi:xanthine permease XanP
MAAPVDVDIHQTLNEETPRHDLLYGLNDNPPFSEALFVAMQHVCAIFIPIVTPGLLVCTALKLDTPTTAYILGMSLFISGIATFIQAQTFGPIGSGLLSIQGTSFAFVTPMLAVAATSLGQGRTSQQALSLILGTLLFLLIYSHHSEPFFASNSEDFYAFSNRNSRNLN